MGLRPHSFETVHRQPARRGGIWQDIGVTAVLRTPMLTDTAIRSLKPGDRPRNVSDGHGLYLLVTPKGSRLWRFKYRMHGIERVLAFGQYPDVTLQSARARRDKARQLVAEGIDRWKPS